MERCKIVRGNMELCSAVWADEMQSGRHRAMWGGVICVRRCGAVWGGVVAE